MAFELPDGKTARTLPEQVKFLTEKLKDLYAAFNELGIKKVEIVESLPEVGQEGILYMVPVEDPDSNNYYEEYIWLDSQWEMIGTTKIDLSGYVTTDTEQTITGTKNFTTGIMFNEQTDPSTYWNVKQDNYNNLIISRVGSNKYMFSNGFFSGMNSGERDLGSAQYKWKDFYFDGAVIGDTFKDSASVTRFTWSTAGYGYFNAHILPSATNTRDLGSSSYTWKTLYLSDAIELANTWRIEYSTALYFKRAGTGKVGLLASVMELLNYDLKFSGTSKLTDGTNTATVADIAALITYAKAQGWIS